jgi:hypothetical protein
VSAWHGRHGHVIAMLAMSRVAKYGHCVGGDKETREDQRQIKFGPEHYLI